MLGFHETHTPDTSSPPSWLHSGEVSLLPSASCWRLAEVFCPLTCSSASADPYKVELQETAKLGGSINSTTT